MSLKRLYESAEVGNFKEAIEIVKVVNLTTSEAVDLLCYVLGGISSKNQFTLKELEEIVSIASGSVRRPDDTEKKNCLICAFHLFKYFAKENASDVILRLKKTWSPDFLTPDSWSESFACYSQLCRSLYNFIGTNIKEIEKANKLIDLLVILIEKMPLNKAQQLFEHLKYLLYTTANRNILEYFIDKLLPEKEYETELLDVYLRVVSNALAFEQLSQVPIKDPKLKFSPNVSVTLLNILKEIIEKGISIQILVSLQIVLKETEKTKVLLYTHILKKLFYDLYNTTVYDHKDKSGWEFHSEMVKLALKMSEICEEVIMKFAMLRTVVASFKHCLRKNEEIPPNRFKTMIESTKKAFSLLEDLQKENYKSWETHFSDLIILLYNTSHNIYKQSKCLPTVLVNSEIILEMVIDEYTKMEKFLSSKVSYNETHVLHSSVSLLSTIYDKQDKTIETMTVHAYNILRCEEEFSNCPSSRGFVHVKVKNKDILSIKKLTTACLLTDKKLNFFNKTYDKDELIRLLLKETAIYNYLYKSKIPLSECCKQIYDLNDIKATIEALVMGWFEMPTAMVTQDQMNHLLADVLKKLKPSSFNNQELIKIAKLHFLRYHSEIQTIQKDITTQKIVEPQERSDWELRLLGLELENSRWDCAVYEQLKIENLNRVKAPLLDSRNIIQELFESVRNIEEVFKEHKILEFVIELANTFLLHKDEIEYLKTLLLCRKIAEKLSSEDYQVKAIGKILRETGANSNVSLLLAAKKLFKKVNVYTAVQFYINMGMGEIKVKNVEAAKKNFRRAKNQMMARDVKDSVLELELEFLGWLLLDLPCNVALPDMCKEVGLIEKRVKEKLEAAFANKAYISNYVIYMKIQYVIRLMTSLFWRRRPAQSRGIAKCLVPLCQTYVLPMQYAETFVYLGNMDIATTKFDDCHAKLRGLSDLLKTTEKKTKNPRDLDIDDTLSHRFQEMDLEAKPANTTFSFAPSSPPLETDSVATYPEFFSHSDSCLCFYCTSFEYQNLVLAQFVLKGNLWASRKEPKTSEHFFNFARKLANRVMVRKSSYLGKIENVLDIKLNVEIEDRFIVWYGYLLYSHCQNLIGTEVYVTAIEPLIEIMSRIKHSNIFLYNEICLQLIQHHSISVLTPLRTPLSPLPTTNPILIKTPEKSQLQCPDIPIAKGFSPKPQRNVALRPLKVNWGDENDSDNENSASSTNKAKVKIEKPKTKQSKENPSRMFAVPSGSALRTPRNTVQVYASEGAEEAEARPRRHLRTPRSTPLGTVPVSEDGTAKRETRSAARKRL